MNPPPRPGGTNADSHGFQPVVAVGAATVRHGLKSEAIPGRPCGELAAPFTGELAAQFRWALAAQFGVDATVEMLLEGALERAPRDADLARKVLRDKEEIEAKVGIDQARTDVFADLVQEDLRNRLGFRVIGRADIEAMLGLEKMKDALGCDDETCGTMVSASSAPASTPAIRTGPGAKRSRHQARPARAWSRAPSSW